MVITFSSSVKDTKEESLGRTIQAQLDLLRSWRFDCNTVICNPQSGLVGLKHKFPGIVFDVTGAGDHLPKLDVKMWRVKETYRCVKSDVPWEIPNVLVDDMVKYCVSRINTRRTRALMKNVCPRVRLTGRKVNYRKEYGLGFGDYVEVKTNSDRSNTQDKRSEPCIALYPAMNLAASWVFWNIKTKRRIRRSVYKKCKTTNLVRDAMNSLSGIGGIITAEEVARNVEEGATHAYDDCRLSNIVNRESEKRLERHELLLANLSVKKSIRQYGKLAVDAIVKEFSNLF